MTTEPVQYTRFTLLKLRAQGGAGEAPGRGRADVKAPGRQQPRLDQWAPVLRRVVGAGMRRLLRGVGGLQGEEDTSAVARRMQGK